MLKRNKNCVVSNLEPFLHHVESPLGKHNAKGKKR